MTPKKNETLEHDLFEAFKYHAQVMELSKAVGLFITIFLCILYTLSYTITAQYLYLLASSSKGFVYVHPQGTWTIQVNQQMSRSPCFTRNIHRLPSYYTSKGAVQILFTIFDTIFIQNYVVLFIQFRSVLQTTLNVLQLGSMPLQITVFSAIQIQTAFMDAPCRLRASADYRVSIHYKFVYKFYTKFVILFWRENLGMMVFSSAFSTALIFRMLETLFFVTNPSIAIL